MTSILISLRSIYNSQYIHTYIQTNIYICIYPSIHISKNTYIQTCIYTYIFIIHLFPSINTYIHIGLSVADPAPISAWRHPSAYDNDNNNNDSLIFSSSDSKKIVRQRSKSGCKWLLFYLFYLF